MARTRKKSSFIQICTNALRRWGDIAGWFGVGLIILSTVVVLTGFYSETSYIPYVLKILGAANIIFYASVRRSKQAVVLNAFALCTTLTDILKMFSMMH
jgi:hypothetical protein